MTERDFWEEQLRNWVEQSSNKDSARALSPKTMRRVLTGDVQGLADTEYLIEGGIRGAPTELTPGPPIYTPVVDEIQSAMDMKASARSASESFGKGDLLGAGGHGAMTVLAGLGTIPVVGRIPAALRKAVRKKPGKPKQIRGLPVDEGIEIARKEGHLKQLSSPSNKKLLGTGKYIGGPRNINTKQQLTKMRENFDKFVARDPRGGDWYDRYRADLNKVTGEDPVSNKWMAAQEGQWSAGVSPQAELGFSIKENNAMLAGMPEKAGRPLMHKALVDATETGDVNKLISGPKTGEYRDHITPGSKLAKTATGVNDFRHAINLGFTEASGIPQRQGLSSQQHLFADYETALAVDRANSAKLGGRSNWTGEQLQAAPWVTQKGDDLFGNGDAYRRRAAQQLKFEQANDISPEKIEALARENAFNDANKQIGDYFPKHTAYATYESQPGPTTGHLPGLQGIPDAAKDAIHENPLSSFGTAPGDRDSIYSGLRYGDTGVAARVMPTVQSQGIYQPPTGPLEMNLGEVARPLVGIKRLPDGQGELAAADRTILEAGETMRAALAGQDAGAAHGVFQGGKVGGQRSLRIPMDRKLSRQELLDTKNVLGEFGLDDVIDTGSGVTGTSFSQPLEEFTGQSMREALGGVKKVLGNTKEGFRVNVDGIYADLTDAWKAGEGSGRVSQQVLDKINVTPELRSAFNNNPYIAQNALNYISRDADLAKQFGTKGRKDLETLRGIIGDGPGWVERLETAVKGGVVPGIAAAFLTSALLVSQDEDGA